MIGDRNYDDMNARYVKSVHDMNEHEKFRHQHCPICGELAIIIDDVLICDDCGHREKRSQ